MPTDFPLRTLLISLAVLALAALYAFLPNQHYSKMESCRSLSRKIVVENTFYHNNLDTIFKEVINPALKLSETKVLTRCDPSLRTKIDATIETLRKDREDIGHKRKKFFNADIISKTWVYISSGNQYKNYIEMEEKYKEAEEKLREVRSDIDIVCL